MANWSLEAAQAMFPDVKARTARAVEAAEAALDEGMERAMNQFNRRIAPLAEDQETEHMAESEEG